MCRVIGYVCRKMGFTPGVTCHIFVWLPASHVTWPIYKCDTSHSHMRCDMTHLCVWHDSFMCATWLIYVCDMTHLYVWHDSARCVTWLMHMWDSARCVSWLIHMSARFVSWLIHMSFTCETSIFTCETQLDVCLDSFTCETWLIHTSICVSMCVLTHSHVRPLSSSHDTQATQLCVWHDSFIYATTRLHVCVRGCVRVRVCVSQILLSATSIRKKNWFLCKEWVTNVYM